MQDVLYVPAVRDFAVKEPPPLRVLCLPGRECNFLLKLIGRGLTDVANVTCIEYEPLEALLIRGRLAPLAGPGRAQIDIVTTSVYDFFCNEARAVERRYHVIDLDPYGRLQDAKSDLLDSVEAALDVQSRADVREWLLLLQTEVASARDLPRKLMAAEASLMREHREHVARRFNETELADQGNPARLLRYAAGVGAFLVDSAHPRFEARLYRYPVFYRGSDEYGVPSRRALMGAFAVRMAKPTKPIGRLGPRAREDQLNPLVDECVGKCRNARSVVVDLDGGFSVLKGLALLDFAAADEQVATEV